MRDPHMSTVLHDVTTDDVRTDDVTAAAAPGAAAGRLRLDHLDTLESEAIHIFREVAAEFERPVLLFSGGKDSVVMLHLAAKAFWPAPVPFTLLHVDTGHNFPEVLDYRDRTVARLGARLEVAHVQDYIDDGRLNERTDGTRNPLQTQPLLDAIVDHRFDAVFGGARRDGMLMAVNPFLPMIEGETPFRETVRFRTIGDATCTAAVESVASSVSDVIAETAVARVTERGATRADDKISEAGMEDRKRLGYF